MRVIAGVARGRRLKPPRGRDVRPTADRVKESLFNVLAPRLAGCAFIDLCAGAGGVGIEALSRGAARAVFVDQSPVSLRLIEENLQATGLAAAGRHGLLRGEAAAIVADLAARGEGFDLAFVDPPYGGGLVPPILAALAGALTPDGIAIAEHHKKDPMPEQVGVLRRFRQLTFGETVLSLYAHAAAGEVP